MTQLLRVERGTTIRKGPGKKELFKETVHSNRLSDEEYRLEKTKVIID